LRVLRFAPISPGRDAANLAQSVTRLKKGRELTKQFLSVLEAEGGHLGKPG
jgi:hypothetical protein